MRTPTHRCVARKKTLEIVLQLLHGARRDVEALLKRRRVGWKQNTRPDVLKKSIDWFLLENVVVVFVQDPLRG